MPTFRGGPIAYKATSELTIATGAITVLGNVHTVDTESDAANDDLDTITAGDNVLAGHLLIISAANAGRDVVVKDGTGNINLPGGDYTIDDADKRLTLIYDGPNWEEISRGSLLTTRGDTLVASSGVVAGTRLPLGAAGTVLTSDGSDASWEAASGAVTGYTATLTDAVNTTSAVNVVTASVDDMGDGDVLEIWFASLVKNNKGSTVNGTFKFVWGSDKHTMLAALDWGNSATEGKQFGFVRCQRVGADLWIYNGAAISGVTNLVERKTWYTNFGGGSLTSLAAVISGATFDSAQAVGIEIQFDAADATTYLKPQGAVIIRKDGNA